MNKSRKAKKENQESNSRLPEHELRRLALNKRRISLKRLLIRKMGLPLTHELPPLNWDDIEAAGLDAEVKRVMHMLDFNEKQIPLPLVPPEIELCNIGFLLDEEEQFNIHRFQTLQSSIYALPMLQPLEHYGAYCQLAESSRRGKGALPGRRKVYQLKMQAMQDYLYDCLPVVHSVPIVRLSVYDLFETPDGISSLHDLLLKDDEKSQAVLMHYFEQLIADLSDQFETGC